MSFFEIYGLFLLKAFTLFVLFVFLLIVWSGLKSKKGGKGCGRLKITALDKEYRQRQKHIVQRTLPKKAMKKQLKALGKAEKPRKNQKPRLFVLTFEGDVQAHQVAALREEVSAVLMSAQSGDEVAVILDSPGGSVNGYGLAASQLARLRDAKIPLTVLVDKVAASGGYMMACVANKIVAAPFAIIGSIGVIMQLPNFHRWLDEHGVNMEQVMAGDYKRTLTMFGKNTKAGRDKTQQDINGIHSHFKMHVQAYRPKLDIEEVATGEYWLAQQAQTLGLVDTLMTSDDYLMHAYLSRKFVLFGIEFVTKKRGFMANFVQRFKVLSQLPVSGC